MDVRKMSILSELDILRMSVRPTCALWEVWETKTIELADQQVLNERDAKTIELLAESKQPNQKNCCHGVVGQVYVGQ